MEDKIKNQGLTLIEIMVAVTIFALVFGIVFGLFAVALKAQKKSLSSQNLLSEESYVMEYMSRQLRIARKQKDLVDFPADKCFEDSDPNLSYEVIDSGHGIKFVTYSLGCVQFVIDSSGESNRLRREVNIDPPLPASITPEYLTSANLNVEEFNVSVFEGTSTGDVGQPRVVLYLKMKGAAGTPGEQSAIEIQNTVSQRNLNVQ